MNLKLYLKQEGTSAAAFGRQVGATRAAVSLWLKGHRIPSPDTMNRIIKETAGDVRPNDFYADWGTP